MGCQLQHASCGRQRWTTAHAAVPQCSTEIYAIWDWTGAATQRPQHDHSAAHLVHVGAVGAAGQRGAHHHPLALVLAKHHRQLRRGRRRWRACGRVAGGKARRPLSAARSRLQGSMQPPAPAIICRRPARPAAHLLPLVPRAPAHPGPAGPPAGPVPARARAPPPRWAWRPRTPPSARSPPPTW